MCIPKKNDIVMYMSPPLWCCLLIRFIYFILWRSLNNRIPVTLIFTFRQYIMKILYKKKQETFFILSFFLRIENHTHSWPIQDQKHCTLSRSPNAVPWKRCLLLIRSLLWSSCLDRFGHHTHSYTSHKERYYVECVELATYNK